jgi:predicted ABC-type ATPase
MPSAYQKPTAQADISDQARKARKYTNTDRTMWGKPTPPKPLATKRKTAPVGAFIPVEWVDPYSAYSDCDVNAAEFEAATVAARKDLLTGKVPVAEGTPPHLLLTIGAPGSGKSTVAAAVAADRGDGDYVTIDLDTAVKYHPRYKDIWSAPSALTGRSTMIGFTLSYIACNATLEDMLIRIYEEIVFNDGPRFNVILQSHAQVNIILAKLAGYRVSLLYVGTPLAVARKRSRTRAAETGKFLAPTLAVQDDVVESNWVDYRLSAVWYGMWADEFIVVDNRREFLTNKADLPRAILDNVQIVPLHCANWDECRLKAQKIVDAACT